MSSKSHIFQVWEKDNQDFVLDGPRVKLIATFDTPDEAEEFVRKQDIEKNDWVACDSYDDYTYIMKREHRNKVK